MFDWSIFGPERGPRIRCRAVGNISDGYGSFDIWGKSTMVEVIVDCSDDQVDRTR